MIAVMVWPAYIDAGVTSYDVMTGTVLSTMAKLATTSFARSERSTMCEVSVAEPRGVVDGVLKVNDFEIVVSGESKNVSVCGEAACGDQVSVIVLTPALELAL